MDLSSIAVLTAAPFIGSFIGCVADRLPAGRPLLLDRSRCDNCDHVLGPRDLVPIVSWCAGGAKCRHCAGRISPYYPLVEVAAILIAVSAIAIFEGELLWISLGFGALLLTLAAMDLRHMILADSLTLALVVAGVIVAVFWSRLPFLDHAIGGLVGGGVLYGLNRLYRIVRGKDGLGLGDVKLLAAAGVWLGWQGLPSVLLYATLSALLCVSLGWFGRLARDTAVPFGTFICLGAWLTWTAGWIG